MLRVGCTAAYCVLQFSFSQLSPQVWPAQLGAQIWIEPGQTPAEIDGWFRLLAEAKTPFARLFL
jgi:hypothetical protein